MLTDRIKKNRCFGNGQFLSLNNNLEYFEGFMNVNGNFIHHGFNGIENHFFDATVEINPEAFLDFNGNKPSVYYGIHIPREILGKNADSILKYEHYGTSLLSSYFKE